MAWVHYLIALITGFGKGRYRRCTGFAGRMKLQQTGALSFLEGTVGLVKPAENYSLLVFPWDLWGFLNQRVERSIWGLTTDPCRCLRAAVPHAEWPRAQGFPRARERGPTKRCLPMNKNVCQAPTGICQPKGVCQAPTKRCLKCGFHKSNGVFYPPDVFQPKGGCQAPKGAFHP